MGGRPGATRHRALLRRRAHANTLRSVLAGVVVVVAGVRNRDSPFGVFLNVFIAGETPSVRHCRDILPIPRVRVETVASLIPDAKEFAADLTMIANFSLAACSFLYGGMRAIDVPAKPTGAQRHAHGEIIPKWWSLIRHVSGNDDFIRSLVSTPFFVRSGANPIANPVLIADRVDGISKCGQVNTASWLPSEAQQLFDSATALFPDGLEDVPVTVAFKVGRVLSMLSWLLHS